MEFDATQVIDLPEYNDDTDDENVDLLQRKRPVARLKMMKTKEFEEMTFSVFEGVNIIGRDTACNICLPAKSLSKQHTCIEVTGNMHLIYDMNSRNKTRRGKLFLQPDVRYELKNNDQLSLADVICVYTILTTTMTPDDRGSETDSMPDDKSPAAYISTNNNNNDKAADRVSAPRPTTALFAASTAYDDDSDTASDASCDLLQPVPGSDNRLFVGGEKRSSQPFAEDSFGDFNLDTVARRFPQSNESLCTLSETVFDSPGSQRPSRAIAAGPNISTTCVPDSDGDTTDDEGHLLGGANTSPQVQLFTGSNTVEDKITAANLVERSSNALSETLLFDDNNTTVTSSAVDPSPINENIHINQPIRHVRDSTGASVSFSPQSCSTQMLSPQVCAETSYLRLVLDVSSGGEESRQGDRSVTSHVPDDNNAGNDEEKNNFLKPVSVPHVKTKINIRNKIGANANKITTGISLVTCADNAKLPEPTNRSGATFSQQPVVKQHAEDDIATQPYDLFIIGDSMVELQQTVKSSGTELNTDDTCTRSDDYRVCDNTNSRWNVPRSNIDDVATQPNPADRNNVTAKLHCIQDDMPTQAYPDIHDFVPSNLTKIKELSCNDITTKAYSDFSAQGTTNLITKSLANLDDVATQAYPDFSPGNVMSINTSRPNLDDVATQAYPDFSAQGKSTPMRKSPANIDDVATQAYPDFSVSGNVMSINTPCVNLDEVATQAYPDFFALQSTRRKPHMNIDESATQAYPDLSKQQSNMDDVATQAFPDPAACSHTVMAPKLNSDDIATQFYSDTPEFKKPELAKPTELNLDEIATQVYQESTNDLWARSSASVPDGTSAEIDQDSCNISVNRKVDKILNALNMNDADVALKVSSACGDAASALPSDKPSHFKSVSVESNSPLFKPECRIGRQRSKTSNQQLKDESQQVSCETSKMSLGKAPTDAGGEESATDKTLRRKSEFPSLPVGRRRKTCVPDLNIIDTIVKSSSKGGGRGRRSVAVVAEQVQSSSAAVQLAKMKADTSLGQNLDTDAGDKGKTNKDERKDTNRKQLKNKRKVTENASPVSPVEETPDAVSATAVVPSAVLGTRVSARHNKGSKAQDADFVDDSERKPKSRPAHATTDKRVDDMPAVSCCRPNVTKNVNEAQVCELDANNETIASSQMSVDDDVSEEINLPMLGIIRCSVDTTPRQNIPNDASEEITFKSSPDPKCVIKKSSADNDKTVASISDDVKITSKIRQPGKKLSLDGEKCISSPSTGVNNISDKIEEDLVGLQAIKQKGRRNVVSKGPQPESKPVPVPVPGRRKTFRLSKIDLPATSSQSSSSSVMTVSSPEVADDRPDLSTDGLRVNSSRTDLVEVTSILSAFGNDAIRSVTNSSFEKCEAEKVINKPTEVTKKQPGRKRKDAVEGNGQTKISDACSFVVVGAMSEAEITTEAGNTANKPNEKSETEKTINMPKEVTKKQLGRKRKDAVKEVGANLVVSGVSETEITTAANSKRSQITSISDFEKIEGLSGKRLSVKSVAEQQSVLQSSDDSPMPTISARSKSAATRKSQAQTALDNTALSNTSSELEASGSKRSQKQKKTAALIEENVCEASAGLSSKPEQSVPVTPTSRSRLSFASTRGTPKAARQSMSSDSSERQSEGQAMTRPKVMFTGVVDEDGQKIVRSLGGEMVDSVYECTHLVTDQVRRTVKFLCGLARGIKIIDPLWLQRCREAGKFISGDPFIVSDKLNERKFDFCLVQSLDRASHYRLLTGYKIHVTKSVKPDPNQMRDIIQCAGGQYIATMPKKHEDQTVVVTCEEDRASCKSAISAKIPLVTAEFILTGLLRQLVEIDLFKLLTSNEIAASSSRSATKRQSLEPVAAVATKATKKK